MDKIDEPCTMKRRVNAFAEGIDTCLYDQSKQTGMGQNV